MASAALMAQGDARRRQLVKFLAEYIKKNGYSPSIMEIAEYMGLTKTAIAYHLKKLQEDGQVSMAPGKYRSLRVL